MLSSPGHRRVKIWGLLEARLLAAIPLAGRHSGPLEWRPILSSIARPSRSAPACSAPERRIGQMADDFVAACGAPRCLVKLPAQAARRRHHPVAFPGSGSRLSLVSGAGRSKRSASISELADMLDAGGAPSPVAALSPPFRPADCYQCHFGRDLAARPLPRFSPVMVLRLDKLEPSGFRTPRRWEAATAPSFRGFRRQLAIPPAASQPRRSSPSGANFSRPIWTTRRSRSSSGRSFSALRIGSRSSSARAGPASTRPLVETAALRSSFRLSTAQNFRRTARPDRDPALARRHARHRRFQYGISARLADVLSGHSGCPGGDLLGPEAWKAFRPASSPSFAMWRGPAAIRPWGLPLVELEVCRRASANSPRSISMALLAVLFLQPPPMTWRRRSRPQASLPRAAAGLLRRPRRADLVVRPATAPTQRRGQCAACRKSWLISSMQEAPARRF